MLSRGKGAQQVADRDGRALTLLRQRKRAFERYRVLRLPGRLAREARAARLRALHDVTLGADVVIVRGAVIDTARTSGRVVIGDGTWIHRGAMLLPYGGWIELGAECSVNPYTVLYGHGGLRIGRGVRIAAHCVMIPANHRFEGSAPIRAQGLTMKGIRIEDDVWIGANVTVLDGAVIGRGSVIAAGAVVRGTIPPDVVVGGVPARVLRTRSRDRGAADG